MKMKRESRRWFLGMLSAALGLLVWALAPLAGAAGADDPPASGGGGSEVEIKLEGIATFSGVELPLPPPAATTITVSFGVPQIAVAMTVLPTTVVTADAPPAVLANGDRVKVEVDVVNGQLQARTLKLEDFAELELTGTVSGLSGPVALPLSSGSVSFVVSLPAAGLNVPMTITPLTRLRLGPFTLANGSRVEADAVARNGLFFVTKIKLDN